MQRAPTTAYLWVSRIAGLLGIIAVILALITGITGNTFVNAKASTLIMIAIAAFLFAIWALLYEIRDYGPRQR